MTSIPNPNKTTTQLLRFESLQMLDILILFQNATYDLTACLLNCSNKGQCKLDSATFKYYCECSTYFKGTSCEFNTQPCSHGLCLSNGTCIPYANSTLITYQCQCRAGFYGTNCENQINPCANQTCSLNGYCVRNETSYQCECFNDFYGDNCEQVAPFMKVIQAVQLTSLVIALTTMITFVALIILNDVLNLLCVRSKKHVNLKNWKQKWTSETKSKPVKFKHVYRA